MRTKLPPKYSSAPQGGVFWHMMQKYVLPEKNQGFHSPGDFSDEIYHHSISSFLLPERLIRLLAYHIFHPFSIRLCTYSNSVSFHFSADPSSKFVTLEMGKTLRQKVGAK